MQAAAFDYHRAASLDEAIALLRDTEGARAIAGGHSLLPAMKLRVSTPSALVDIGRIPRTRRNRGAGRLDSHRGAVDP